MSTVTIKHIAAEVGVSKQAVSSALNNRKGQVSPATRARIQAAATRLGYKPNWRARSFARRKSQVIGLVYGRPADYIEQGQFVAVLVEQCNRINHDVMLIPATGPFTAWSAKLQDQRVDGCLITHPTPVEVERFVAQHDIPAVLLNLQSDQPVPQVYFDDREGTQQLMTHLLGLGHRRIWYYCSPKDDGQHYSNHDRREGYAAAMQQAGLSHQTVGVIETQTDLIARLLALPVAQRPTALVVYNSTDAVPLMHHLWRAGIQVPRDLSIASFNDDDQARYAIPPLTTMAMPIKALVQRCLALVLEYDAAAPVPPPEALPQTLVVRESTASPPG